MPQFDSKIFNGEVFKQYVDRVPNTKLTELLRSRAIVARPDLVASMQDQVGGNYITTPLKGLISGAVPVNYDGETDITSNSTKTFSHSRVVVGRANAWTEKDFSYDITGGVDFMENVAQQIAEYWGEIDQATIIHILKGVFNMTDAEGAKFVRLHTHDVTAVTNSEGKLGLMDATTLNTGMQKAMGDNKGKFSMAIMHSKVATDLENLKVLVYLKYNDGNGIERDLSIATLNGRLVLIDDGMPTESKVVTAAVKGVYTVKVATALDSGDKVVIDGVEYAYDSGATTATAQATAIETLLKADESVTAKYDITRSSATITFTETEGNEGVGAPSVDTTDVTTGAFEEDTTTEGAEAVTQTAYTTYVFGDGAIEYTDCGAKVPYEMDRDPKVNGGQDTLYTRQRKCWSPYGISFTKKYMAKLSPTDSELENGGNWEIVNTNTEDGKEYLDIKAIPIARIISLG